ncbi:alpha/beta fold hydrolase [Roseovarius rhodophyticola]|uniref:Alpha/beta fold hydrolase n=1 Tax=Roseovarius rhodophyticola TaxID=3080827 RepID=A0ABZ2TCA1_9RHOB|nr:alpha/beta fold hydrolase [Roseovarius sp. W115]MDV2931074.1 alpha/beta fold hydrolase [Roseovarius sp. W115]
MWNGTAFDLSGPEDAPVVALIHGLGLNRQITWHGVLPGVSSRYRVLSYDLLGHGQSAVPEGEVTLTALSQQLVDLMDHLKVERAALVGFSLGGMINRRVALDHPERVSALAILNSPHEREPEAQAMYEKAARDSAAGGPKATVDAALKRWFTEEFHAQYPDTVARVRQIVVANDPANYAAHRYVLAAGVTELIRPDPPIDAPALVMTCEHDSGSTPAMSWAIAHEMAEAQVEIVPDLRHLGLVERPEVFAEAVLRFFEEAM